LTTTDEQQVMPQATDQWLFQLGFHQQEISGQFPSPEYHKSGKHNPVGLEAKNENSNLPGQ
jgi:hypothetical protein